MSNVEQNHASQNRISAILSDLENLRVSSVAEAKTAIKHGNFVGVSDPTGHIPPGHVFLTGMGERPPPEVFLTRVSNLLIDYHLMLHIIYINIL